MTMMIVGHKGSEAGGQAQALSPIMSRTESGAMLIGGLAAISRLTRVSFPRVSLLPFPPGSTLPGGLFSL
jgi:hypothetical protein